MRGIKKKVRRILETSSGCCPTGTSFDAELQGADGGCPHDHLRQISQTRPDSGLGLSHFQNQKNKNNFSCSLPLGNGHDDGCSRTRLRRLFYTAPDSRLRTRLGPVRCRENMSNIRQSRADSGLGSSHFFSRKSSTPFKLSPLRSVAECEDRIGTGPPRARPEVIYLDSGYWAIPRSINQKGNRPLWRSLTRKEDVDSGTDPDSYMTEYTVVYEDKLIPWSDSEGGNGSGTNLKLVLVASNLWGIQCRFGRRSEITRSVCPLAILVISVESCAQLMGLLAHRGTSLIRNRTDPQGPT